MAKHRRTNRAPSINSIGARIPEEQGLRLAATSRDDAKTFRKSPRTHVDDIAVDQLASAMKAKLAEKRKEGAGGWDNPLECSIERLAQLMAEALCKGKLVNVANYAAMLRARGASEQVVAEHAMRAFLQGSRETMAAKAEQLERLTASLSNIVHDQVVVMQAAWIEWEHGRGADDAMGWIHNTLCGPGHIPDEDAPYGMEAQAWFDANQSNPMPQCFCGRPSHIGWMKQGFCSEAHYAEAKVRATTNSEAPA
ncbi:hypothetical protein CNE_1c11680 [Cupriavidus necator N-1]|uniref:Uncharacterized protein n=1 Tax=Cupriavidus necator (strain ATCC 43291 / DSM 13513 / CCUG 52238 / LMG 8453 / N-1) TaxID=1042878 RepID=G0ER05_CUPNN|nr:hypothetical protein [Cupriavidus necator]AEI76523.1 hypothetical protein CNE_1c11680 [Cupriavidus necator N-1]MDX6011356.1 hypothetical protein [Cupriavidus necator]